MNFPFLAISVVTGDIVKILGEMETEHFFIDPEFGEAEIKYWPAHDMHGKYIQVHEWKPLPLTRTIDDEWL